MVAREMPAMMRGFGGAQMPAAAPLKVAFDEFTIESRGKTLPASYVTAGLDTYYAQTKLKTR